MIKESGNRKVLIREWEPGTILMSLLDCVIVMEVQGFGLKGKPRFFLLHVSYNNALEFKTPYRLIKCSIQWNLKRHLVL